MIFKFGKYLPSALLRNNWDFSFSVYNFVCKDPVSSEWVSKPYSLRRWSARSPSPQRRSSVAKDAF